MGAASLGKRDIFGNTMSEATSTAISWPGTVSIGQGYGLVVVYKEDLNSLENEIELSIQDPNSLVEDFSYHLNHISIYF